VSQAISGYPFGWIAAKLSRLLRIPCLIVLLGGQELADLPEIHYGDLRNKKRFRRIAWACERADALVALSRFQARALRNLGMSPERAELIPFGIDTSRFPYFDKPLEPPYVFLHVSYSVPVKDTKTLIDAFRIINESVDSRLLVIGQDYAGQSTDSLIKASLLEAPVQIVGSLPNNQIARYLKKSHFLLHTSRYESQGVVFNEAMACGVVVCATRVGLASDLGENYCISSDVGDSAGLADKIIGAIRDEDRYARLRSNGYRWSVSHDVKWTAAEYRKIYEQL